MVELNGIDQQEQELQQMVGRLAAMLASESLSCTTAESCTGGLLAKTFTDVPGSSSWFEQGWVTYSNRAKQNLLGVKKELLDMHGAVSEEVVLAMAVAARELADSTISVAVSGVAGPGGGSVEKPVGTVWIAWATARHSDAYRYNFEGDRQQVRLFAVKESILGIIERIDTDDVGAAEDRL